MRPSNAPEPASRVFRGVLVAVGALVGASAIALWLGAEAEHHRASARGLGAAGAGGGGLGRRGGRQVVVVLGYRDRARRGRANFVNRFRMRAALRSIDPAAASTLLVCCGGPVGGPVPEAELLAREAYRRGCTGPLELDATSRSTLENLQHAMPHLEDADTIVLVSDALHAEFARAILRHLRPDLADRLARGEEYRFGEEPVIKIAAAFLAARERRRRAAAG